MYLNKRRIFTTTCFTILTSFIYFNYTTILNKIKKTNDKNIQVDIVKEDKSTQTNFDDEENKMDSEENVMMNNIERDLIKEEDCIKNTSGKNLSTSVVVSYLPFLWSNDTHLKN